MRNLKLAGPLVVALAALMVFGATASATTLTSPGGTVYTGEIKAESEGHTLLHNPIVKLECRSVIRGNLEAHGSEVTAKGPATTFTFESCTNNWHKTTATLGFLEIHWTSGNNGTVTSTGMTLIGTVFGINCTFLTQNTLIGLLTGGTPATLHIEAGIPVHSGSSPLCGEKNLNWTGAYKVVTPGTLLIDA